MFKIKFTAFSIHLLISILLVSLIIGFIILFWYPAEYLSITNFKNITLLIISVDLVLGPLLTFIVFNPEKKSLRFDLATVAAIQLSALIYGANALYQTHPLFITYNHSTFNLVHANEVSPENAKYKQFKISKLSSAKLAFAKMPDDPDKQTEIMIGVDIKGEPDIDKRTEYYEPHEKHMETILKDSLDIIELFDKKNLTKSSRDFLKKYDDKKNDYAYIPLKGINGNAIVVLNRKTANFVTTINTDPWKLSQK